MKTYKTWEVIKMLTENSSLKFKEYRWDKVLERRISNDNKWIKIDGLPGDNGRLFTDSEWILEQQPVSFMEASKAFMKGKNVRCDYKSFVNNIPCKVLFEQGKGGKGSMDETELTFYLVTEGKWFIEGE